MPFIVDRESRSRIFFHSDRFLVNRNVYGYYWTKPTHSIEQTDGHMEYRVENFMVDYVENSRRTLTEYSSQFSSR